MSDSNFERDTEYLRELLQMNADYELALRYLREKGYNKLDSIKSLRIAAGLGLDESKHLVHLSQTWRDYREQDDEFHDALEAELNKLSK